MDSEQKLKFGVETSDEVLKANIRKGCIKVRVEKVPFYVPLYMHPQQSATM